MAVDSAKHRLPHTERVRLLVQQGKTQEAIDLHASFVKDQFDRAKTGESINLSDILAAKEILDRAR